jgi:adenosine deaminase
MLDLQNNIIPMKKEKFRHFLEQMPKVELHIHLEGAIPLYALYEIIHKYDQSIPGVEYLLDKFQYKDFSHFLWTWVWKNSFLREYDDFEYLAEQVAKDLVSQNIIYVEMNYSPPMFRHFNLEADKLTEAIRNGFNKVHGIEIQLVADLCRSTEVQNGLKMLEQLNDVKYLGVIGIDLGGDEKKVPPEVWQEAYEKAERFGFYRTAHAGEAVGAESIWGAIRALRVNRIGHGTRAYEDQALLDHLLEVQLPIESCPISNVKTGVISHISSHPIRMYFDKGLLICVNTDDPKMFQNAMIDEYLELLEYHNFTMEEIHILVKNAIKACWSDKIKKQELFKKIDQYFFDQEE